VGRLEATLAELAAQAALVPADLASVHASFHFQVNDIAANRFLARAMGVLYDMLDTGLEATLCLTGRLERSAEVHRRITEAIAAGDSDAARPAMRAHILGSRSVAVRRLRDQGTKP
jgi:DNA-binding FadR family transcriptional regulator